MKFMQMIMAARNAALELTCKQLHAPSRVLGHSCSLVATMVWCTEGTRCHKQSHLLRAGIVPWVATIGALLVYIIAFIPDSRQHAPFTLLYNIGLLVFR